MKWNIKSLISMTLALVLIVGCIGMISIADPANAEEITSGHEKYLEMTVKFPETPVGNAGEGQYYPIALWLPSTIVFNPGDQLVYDLNMSHDVAGFGSIDLCLNTLYMHDLPVRDDDGVAVHPSQKIQGAHNTWKTRRITLPAIYHQYDFSTGGAGPAVVFPVHLPYSPAELAGETVTVKFDNIRIEDANGNVTHWIYQQEETLYNMYLASEFKGYSDVQYSIHNANADSTPTTDNDILQMVIDIPEGATGRLSLYAKVFDYLAYDYPELRLNYNDRLVYDVKILNAIGGIGGIEFARPDHMNPPIPEVANAYMRDRLKDRIGIPAHPTSNIAYFAYNTWWTRSITLDKTYVDAVLAGNEDLYLAVELGEDQVAALAGQRVVIQYDNIRIEHADKTGNAAIKHMIFSSDQVPNLGGYMGGYSGVVNVPNAEGTGTVPQNVGLNISVVDEADAEQASNSTGDLTYGITLKDNIAMNFNVTVLDHNKPNTKVELTVGDTTTVYTADQGKSTGLPNVYQFSAELAPAQMTEYVKVKVTVDSVVNDVPTTEVKHHRAYTVRQYARAYMAVNPGSAAEQLLNEMLNYGAMAQIFFNYNEDDLANAYVTAAVAQNEVPRKPLHTAEISGVVVGLNYEGATLVFENRLSLRFYFEPTTGTLSNYVYTLNGDNVAVGDFKTTSKGTCIEVANILPSAYKQEYLVTADTATGTDNALKIEYSPMAYMCRMYYNSGDAHLQNLLKAMYNYFLAAEAYTAGDSLNPISLQAVTA